MAERRPDPTGRASRRTLVLLLALLILLPAAPSIAHALPAPRAAPSLPVQGPTDRKELQTFVDRFFARGLTRYHVPGAVFVLVKDGTLFFARGYGYADLQRKVPVIPGRTLFRVCSVSKLVTATAVMQLAERGKVQPNEDVNRYLRLFKLPITYPQPVTLAELLTHTAGLDDRHIGRATLDASHLQPLGPYLADRLPARAMPPGQTYSYNDYGYALAGYVVEAVSGAPFARYVDRHIFRPLGMHHSSFAQPLPPSLARQLATGYDVTGSSPPQPAPLEYFNTAPAAAMVATATDMAHLMIAQLDGGRYETSRILSARTVRDMQQQHFSSYPRLPGFPPMPGVAYGFGVYYRNGRRILEHSGALRGFTSLLTLIPGQRLGFFIAGNTPHDTYMFDLQRQLLDHYYPASAAMPVPRRIEPSPPATGRFAGSYWSNEYSRYTIEKLRQLLNQVQVTSTGIDALTAHFWDGRTVRLRQVAPQMFQTVGERTPSYWFFRQAAGGKVVGVVPGGDEVFDRIAWYETTRVQLSFIAAVALTFLSACAVWLVAPLVRRVRRGLTGPGAPTAVSDVIEPAAAVGAGPCDARVPATGPPRLNCYAPCSSMRDSPGRQAAGWLAGLAASLNLFFLVTLLLLMQSAAATQDRHYSWLEYGVPPAVVALLCVPLVTTLLAAAMPVFALLAWKDSYWSFLGRLHYTIVALGALAFIPYLLYWNLLGFHV